MDQTLTKGQLALRQALSSGDSVVLAVTFWVLFSITSIYFIIDFISENINDPKMTPADWVIGLIFALIAGALLFGAILLLGMFLVRMKRQTMLGNSLEVEYSNFAWLRDWANTVSADLEMPQVEIFITQDPYINAYAFGFVRPYCIVLHSGSIHHLTPDELKVLVVHEMAHIKYKHTTALVYLTPFLTLPIVNIIGNWIIGFWQRRVELTCDRLALMYFSDAELVKEALIKVHVGADVAKAMNEISRQWLQYKAERPMNHLAQTLSDHPFLVRRLSNIDKYKSLVEPAAQSKEQLEG